ncbi:hypothetical protein [Leptospira levettii]|uniref:hypothetical protein n=1 Tax=Leptospira levettii TaxID=2023178 RepID=UPI000C2ACCD1|nr:hypothetical protein [Leptospira levettii]PJZ87450.1 hypothetical protein CH368_16725 [Leptospira levettii]
MENRKKNIYSLIAILTALIFAFATGKDDGIPTTGMAKSMCQEFIKKSLKSPKSAEFSSITETRIIELEKGPENYTFQVTGYVDAQNSFGAQIRTNYICKIGSSKGTDNWQLIDLKM